MIDEHIKAVRRNLKHLEEYCEEHGILDLTTPLAKKVSELRLALHNLEGKQKDKERMDAEFEELYERMCAGNSPNNKALYEYYLLTDQEKAEDLKVWIDAAPFRPRPGWK